MPTYAPLGYYAPMGTYRNLGQYTRDYLRYIIEIDWDLDGFFSGDNEVRWMLPGGISYTGGRENWVLASSFDRPEPAVCEIKFENSSGRYSPMNTSSPLYPHLLEKTPRLARVRSIRDDGTIDPWIYGYMTDFSVSGQSGVASTLSVKIVDSGYLLDRSRVSQVMSRIVGADWVLTQLLTNLGWSFGANIDRYSGIVMPYYWCDSDNALNACFEVAENEAGFFFINELGQACFHNRYRPMTPVATFGTENIGSDYIIIQPSDATRDYVKLKYTPRRPTEPVISWSLATPVYIAAGDTVLIYAQAPQTVFAFVRGVNVLSAGTSKGDSNNLTGFFQAQPTYNYGTTLVIPVKNTGTTPGYLNTMEIFTDLLASDISDQVIVGTGHRDFTFESRLKIYDHDALNWSRYVQWALNTQEKRRFIVSIEHDHARQFGTHLMDCVLLNIPSEGVSNLPVRISKKKHELRSRRVVKTTFWLEPFPVRPTVGSLPIQLPYQLPY